MPKVNALQTSVTAGEVSPRLWSRPDLQKYRTFARTVENMIVLPQGGLRKRGGTTFISRTRDDEAVLLVPFQFSTSQPYILVFGESYIRILKDRAPLTYTATAISGITKANPAVVTSTSHGLSNGDPVWITAVGGMHQVNNRAFTVAGATANTFQLSGVDSTGYGTYTSGGLAGEIVEVATTYTADELADLTFAQSADVLYIAHQAHPLATLSRSAATTWTLADAAITNGPFRTINSNRANRLSVTISGSATITGITKANPAVVTTSAAHGFTAGQTVYITTVVGMTEVNTKKYVVTNPTTNTFELWDEAGVEVDSTGYGAYTSGGLAARSVTIWQTYSPGSDLTLTADSAVFEADHVGCQFRLWEPGKFTGVATATAGLTIAKGDSVTNDGKVYGLTNLTGIGAWNAGLTPPTHESGTVRLNTISGGNSVDTVFLHDSSCVVQITAYSSSTSVSARVVGTKHMPKSVINLKTSYWEEGAWSEKRGYPGVIAFHEQRLFAAASASDPQTVWASRTAAFTDFQDGADDDRALVYTIASEKVDAIRWISPGKILTVGTISAEYAIQANNQNDALTPSNVRVARQTAYGSSPARPVRAGPSVLLPQRNGDPANDARKLREFVYSYDVDGFVAPDLTILSEHIGNEGLVQFAYQAEPDSIVWARRGDGTLAGLTYSREQEVVGWHRHEMGGTEAEVENIAVIPGPEGEELYLAVKRTINSSEVRTIEYLRTGLGETEPKEESFFVDCGLAYDGSPTTSITGLSHLEGEAVAVLADGAVIEGLTVEDGAITLPVAASIVKVGLGFTARYAPIELEAGAAMGTTQSRTKRTSQIWIRLYRSLGGEVGGPTERDPIIYREHSTPLGSSPDLVTDWVSIDPPTGWERDEGITFEHSQPLPFTVLAVVYETNVTG